MANRRIFRLNIYGTLGISILTLFMLIPIGAIVASWLTPIDSVWSHIVHYLLPTAIKHTLLLMLLVSIGAGTLGTCLAWLTSMYEFRGRKFFTWALMLPMAIPAYVLAFVSIGFIEFTGPLQSTLRAMGIQASIGSMRNVWMAGFILSLVFYPYVYLLARQAFLTQGRRAIEAGQMLGLTRKQAFFKIALPQARPWIVGGIVIACMETIADFGAVSIFNVDTLTTVIYKVWFSLYQLNAAAQLASVLMVMVMVGVLAEQYWQNKRHFISNAGSSQRFVLSSWQNWLVTVICGGVFLLAFLLPIIQLIWWTALHWQADFNSQYWGYVKNTLTVASVTSGLLVVVAIVMAWLKRQYRSRWNLTLVSFANLGYAVPGTVLAVGVMLPIAWLDNRLINQGIFDKPLLSGSVVIMILALMTRFFAVSFQPIDRQLQRLTPSQLNASLLLTDSHWQRWWLLILPVLRSATFTALLMGFVEVMKEMPITLMTRRHGWDTLAVRVFEMTSEGMWSRAALPSLLIVCVGLVPVWWLIRQSEKK